MSRSCIRIACGMSVRGFVCLADIAISPELILCKYKNAEPFIITKHLSEVPPTAIICLMAWTHKKDFHLGRRIERRIQEAVKRRRGTRRRARATPLDKERHLASAGEAAASVSASKRFEHSAACSFHFCWNFLFSNSFIYSFACYLCLIICLLLFLIVHYNFIYLFIYCFTEFYLFILKKQAYINISISN